MGVEQVNRLARAKVASQIAQRLPLQTFVAFCQQQNGGEVATLNG